MLYYTANVAVKENQESLIILPIESNIEAQTQIKPSERDKLFTKTRVQRKELSKEDEASMDVEVNLLQQKFNKIDIEKLKKLQSHKQEERKKKREDKRNKCNEVDLEIQSAFDRKSVLIKHSKNPILDYPYLLLQEKENIQWRQCIKE